MSPAAPTGLRIEQNELLLTFGWDSTSTTHIGSVICMPSFGGGFDYYDGSNPPATIAVDCADYQNVFLGNSGYILPADASRSMAYNDASIVEWVGSAFDAYNATDTTTRNWADDAGGITTTSFVVCEIYFSYLVCSTPAPPHEILQPPMPGKPDPVTAELYNDIVILVDWEDPRADPVGAPTDPCSIIGYDVQFWDTNSMAWVQDDVYCSSTLATDTRTENHACALPISYCSATLGLSTGDILEVKVRAKCSTVDGEWSDDSLMTASGATPTTFTMP